MGNNSPEEGSRAWAIEQLTPGFGCVSDAAGNRWYKPSGGVGYRRINDDGSDSCFEDLPADMPGGWSLMT